VFLPTAISLAFLHFISFKNLLFFVEFSITSACSSFSKKLISLFSSCLFVFAFLLCEGFPYIFLLLLGSFIVSVMIVAAACVKLFISLISYSFSSKSSSVIPFISSFSFINSSSSSSGSSSSSSSYRIYVEYLQWCT
jgi:hypothetical protein